MLLLEDIYFIRPLITALGLLTTTSIFISSYTHMNKRIFVLTFCIAGLGLPIGMLVYALLPKYHLMLIVGIFTLLVSVRGMMEQFFKVKELSIPSPILYVILFFAGILHGAFTTGGPLMVVFMSQKLKDKHQFRATQSAIWVCFNTILTLQLLVFSNTVDISAHDWFRYALALPFLALAVITGNILHKKVSITLFRKIVYSLLFISALSILISAVV